MSFAENLVRVRGERGMNQKELYIASGITPPQLSRYEKGVIEPGIPTLHILTRSLRCSYNDLLEEK